MIYLVLVVAILFVVGGCIMASRSRDDMWHWFTVPGVVLATTLLTLIPILTLTNAGGLAKWQVFYSTNVKNYEVVVDETVSYLSADKFKDVLVEGSIEKFQLATAVSERIKEWRDAVNEYNSTIASMKYFDSNPFTGVLVPDAVQDMKLLVIK